MSDDPDLDVTRPLVLPRTGLHERRRALLLGTGALGLVALVDTALSGPGPRAAVWAVWFALFAGAAAAMGRASARVKDGLGIATGLIAVVGLAGLAWTSGGAASPFFQFLPVVPLLSAVAAPGEVRDPVVLGAGALGAGVALLLTSRAPTGALVMWSATTAVAVSYAVVAGQLQRRRQAAFFQVERERADALARLAEAERARTSVERWAAMGQVADQVAHDVNSPLGALRSSLAYARAEIQAGRPEAAVEAIVDAADCVERIRLIVAELGARGGFPRAGNGRGS